MQVKPHFSASAVLLAALLASGCATNQGNSQATSQAGVGAVLGCAAGTAVAMLTGGKPGEGCLIGATAGAVLGYADGRRKDLELAEQTRQSILNAAKGSGTEVTLTTRAAKVPEAERSKDNGAQTVEAVDKMVVQVPNTLIARNDTGAVQTFARVGGYVSAAHVPATIKVAARSTKDYDYIVKSIRSGYGPTNPEPDKVKYVYTQLERGTQASVEVAHVG